MYTYVCDKQAVQVGSSAQKRKIAPEEDALSYRSVMMILLLIFALACVLLKTLEWSVV
jgi:hypothetical protein